MSDALARLAVTNFDIARVSVQSKEIEGGASKSGEC